MRTLGHNPYRLQGDPRPQKRFPAESSGRAGNGPDKP